MQGCNHLNFTFCSDLLAEDAPVALNQFCLLSGYFIEYFQLFAEALILCLRVGGIFEFFPFVVDVQNLLEGLIEDDFSSEEFALSGSVGHSCRANFLWKQNQIQDEYTKFFNCKPSPIVISFPEFFTFKIMFCYGK